MSQNPHGLTIGQSLCWVRLDGRGKVASEDVVVTSIGRKYAKTSRNDIRVDLATLKVSGGRPEYGYGLGTCHLSRAKWEAERAIATAWDGLRQKIGGYLYSVPDGVTVEKISQRESCLDLTR